MDTSGVQALLIAVQDLLPFSTIRVQIIVLPCAVVFIVHRCNNGNGHDW